MSMNPKGPSTLRVILIISILLMKSIIIISNLGFLLIGVKLLVGDFFPADLGKTISRLLPIFILGAFSLPIFLRVFYGKIPEDLKYGYLAKLIKQTQDDSTENGGKE